MVLADSGIWVEGSSMYKDHCKYSLHGISGIRCLSTVGWLFTIFFTYTGFILLIFSAPLTCCLFSALACLDHAHSKYPAAAVMIQLPIVEPCICSVFWRLIWR